MKEEARKERNAHYLTELNPVIARKAAAVIADLESHGYRPRLQDAFRTAAEQKQNVANGVSWVSWSFHMATTPDGKPDALAFDLVDDDLLYSSNKFFMLCAMSGAAHGLNSGIWFGLTARQKAILQNKMDERDFDTPSRIGNDGGHLEVSGITLAQAKKGKRPV